MKSTRFVRNECARKQPQNQVAPRHFPICEATLSAMFRLISTRFTHLTVSPLLVLWLMGAGCLLACKTNAQAQDVVEVAETASAGEHRSCHSSGAKSSATEQSVAKKKEARKAIKHAVALSQTASSVMVCCPFAVDLIKAADKVRGDEPAMSVSAIVPRHLAASQSSQHQIAFAPHVRLPNRGHTYLQHCTFLI